MDHRDRPGEGTAKPDAPGRFARLVPPEAARRVALPRLAVAVGAGVLGLIVLVYGLSHLGSTSVAWVGGRSENDIDFRDIELDPPPPAWYRGGAPVFLDRVRATMHQPEHIPYLTVDLSKLHTAFKNYAWVRSARVRRVYPKRIIVSLEYRQPIAEVSWPHHPVVAIDQEGVVVSRTDYDREAAGPLISIQNLPPPHEPRPGNELATKNDDDKGNGTTDIVQATARVAAFLHNAYSAADDSLPPPIVAVLVQDKNLFLQFKPNTVVNWGELAKIEHPNEPTMREKWTMLCHWFRDHPEGVKHPDYLIISKGKVVKLHSTTTGGSGS